MEPDRPALRKYARALILMLVAGLPALTGFLLLVVGYPAPGARVPDIARKPLSDICTFV